MKIEPVEIQVRFADIDVMGHVNNSVYLSYFENARIHYFKYMLGSNWDWSKDGVILLKNELEYIRPVMLNDKPKVKIFVFSIGKKSFTLRYELTVNNVLHCKGLSILVGYNNQSRETVEINPIMRKCLEELKSAD